ncbi:MAG: hypothetical protein OCD76_00740 [Reichenbachiella sp.]
MDTEILIPLTLFISAATTLILFRKFTNDERLALIEKGGDANIFNKKQITFPAVKIGLLLIGAGLGIFIGSILGHHLMGEEQAIFSCILVFGGLGLFFSYFIENNLAKKKGKEES